MGRFLPGSAAAGLTARMEQFLQRDNRERQPLGWQQRQELIPRFEADLELLERVLGSDFSDWRTPRDRSGGMVGARPEGQSQAKNGRPVQPGGDRASGAPGNGAQEPSENGARDGRSGGGVAASVTGGAGRAAGGGDS